MKKIVTILFTLLFIGISWELPMVVEAYTYDIKDEFTFSDRYSFDVVKHEEKAEAKLRELKQVFDDAADVEIKLEKTGTEGLDIFMAYYTGQQAKALEEVYWNAHDLTYEMYWNELVEDLRLISNHIKADVGDYYGVGIAVDIAGRKEILLLVTGGLVMEDKINALNYDPHYIDLFN